MNRNLVYIDTPKERRSSGPAAAGNNLLRPRLSGALKYQDPDYAAHFDDKRKDDPKRVIAKRAIQGMMADLPPGTTVIDAGCGTGLLFPFFASKGFKVLGVDLSPAMLDQAKNRVRALIKAGAEVGNLALIDGSVNVCRLPLDGKIADVSVMSDLTRWLSPQECQQAMRELMRVTKSRIIWTARVANHKDARAIELFESVLDGWKITRNEAGIDTDYRILMAEPV